MCSVVVLTACGAGDQEELSKWMQDVRAQTKVSVQKLPEPKKYEPYSYQSSGQLDPFDPQKVAVAQAKLQAKSSNANRPDLDRRREPLEAFPLDTLSMVGVLIRGSKVSALIKVDKTIYPPVNVGDYMGQNFGRIAAITETEVTLKEKVQDAAGEWTERVTKLQLQEAKK
jgi:type IV pilus assembly protein PilP